MGNGNIRSSKIKDNELKELCRITRFNKYLVICFHKYFIRFSIINKEDGVIDLPEFLEIIKQKNNYFSRNLFNAFDQNCNYSVNFREFIKFYATFQNGNSAAKTKLIFTLFSNPNTKCVDKESLTNILVDGINGNNALSQFITKDEIDNIVTHSFHKYKKLLVNDYKSNFIKKKHEENDNFAFYRRSSTSDDKSKYKIQNSMDIKQIINDNSCKLNFDNFSIIFNNFPSISSWMTINDSKLKYFLNSNENDNFCCP